MPSIGIPEGHRPAVEALTRLPAEVIPKLDRDLVQGRSNAKSAREVLGAYVDEPALVLDALISMARTCRTYELTPSEFLSGIRETLGTDAGDADFSSLLSNAAIVRLAKRIEVQYAHERVLQSFRIFTEMRPIFDEEVSPHFDAAVLTHSVEIAYLGSGEMSDTYLTISDSDLLAIKKQIDRALEKSAAMKQFLDRAGVTLLTDKEDEES